MYRAENILKSIRGRTLISGVSLSCEAGRAIAVIGPNGAGKTVLLKALSMADPPTAGEIEIDGSLFRFPRPDADGPIAIWPHLTFVFQQLFLWPHLTLLENITLAAELRATDTRSVRNLARELSRYLGIESLLSRYPNQVSGGQRQRAALARALLLRPKWLLLDEPNSAQDVEQIATLTQLLLRTKAGGTGIIFSTHLMGFAGSVADEVVFLDQGTVVERGSVDILSKPKTERMRRFISIVEHGSVRADPAAE